MLFSDKREQGPKAQLSPSEVPVLEKRRQISVGSSLPARSPDPAQKLSWLREPDAQDPSGPRLLRPPRLAGEVSGKGVGRSHRLCPRQAAVAVKSQGQGWGRGSPLSQGLNPASGWPWRGLWSHAGDSPQFVLKPPQLTRWPKTPWAGMLGAVGEGRNLPLTSLLTPRPAFH